MSTTLPTTKVISPTPIQLLRLMTADRREDIRDVFGDLNIPEDVGYLQINVPQGGDECESFERYSYDGKIVLSIDPADFGVVLVKEMHEELFKF